MIVGGNAKGKMRTPHKEAAVRYAEEQDNVTVGEALRLFLRILLFRRAECRADSNRADP